MNEENKATEDFGPGLDAQVEGGSNQPAVSEDMSKDELLEIATKALKKANDQELGRRKYQKQVKDLKALLNGDAETQEEPTQEAPKKQVAANSSREEIRLIGEGYSDSEIDQIKAYAQAYDMSLTDASKDGLLQANISRARDERHSAMASLNKPTGASVASSDKDFQRAAMNGDVDLTNPANAKRLAKIVADRASR